LKRLLFYSKDAMPGIGGLQYVIHFWAAELAARGYHITILTETPDTGKGPAMPITPEGVVYRRQWPRWQQYRCMRQADAVIMFNISLKGLPLWILARLTGGPALYATHHTGLWYEGGPRPLRQRLKQWVANNLVTRQCACSAYIAALYRHCRVVYSPAQVQLFVPKGVVPARTGDIIFAGRHVSDKGVDLLLTALHALHALGHKARLTVAGSGPDTAALKNQARALGLLGEAGVVFTGALSQQQLITALQCHGVMVVPSRMEPMGMVVAEGLAAGCTMVVARQGGLPEVGGAFCHYFEPNNAADLCRALQEALTCPIRPDPAALQQHLQQFTVEYSVGEVVGMLIG
jgi:glycosyltransferase involved in cell wall biosynthesis